MLDQVWQELEDGVHNQHHSREEFVKKYILLLLATLFSDDLEDADPLLTVRQVCSDVS